MRQVTEIKPDTAATVLGVLNEGITDIQQPRYFGKIRAYLFMNFLCIEFLLILIFCRLFMEEGFLAMMILPGLALNTAVTYLIWHGVKKKVPHGAERIVFWAFFATGVLVMGKILLICTVILIPLVAYIGGEGNLLEYRYVESGTYAGSYVLSRRKLNGQIVDNMGNVYEE